MFRTLGINLVRSIICNLIVYIISTILTALVFALIEAPGIAKLSDNALALSIGAAIFTGFFSAVLFGVASEKKWKFIFGNVTIGDSRYWKKRIAKKRPLHAFWLYTSLLIHLAFAVGCIIFLHFYHKEMTYCMKNEIQFIKGVDYDDTALFVIGASSVIVFQVIYYLVMAFHYSDAICHKCKHIFCLYDTNLVSYDVERGTDYKTKHGRVQVGSFEAGGTEIAKVYKDVSATYSRDVKSTRTTYACRCGACDASSRRTEYESEVGDWK